MCVLWLIFLDMQKKSYKLLKSGQNIKSVDIVRQSKWNKFVDQTNLNENLLKLLVVKIRAQLESPSSELLIHYVTRAARLFNKAAMELVGKDEPDLAL